MMQNMVMLNDTAIPQGVSLSQECIVASSTTLKSSLGKRLHDDLLDLFSGDEDDFSAATASTFDSTEDEKSEDIMTSPTKRRRTVRFTDAHSVAHVQRLDRALWYSRQDLVVMKSTAKRQSRQLNLDATLGPAYGLPITDNNRHLPTVVRLGIALTLECF